MRSWLTMQGESALVRVKVLPGASRNALGGERAGELVVRVAAPPEKGKANEELIRFLSKLLGVPRNSLALVSGDTARHKILRVPADAVERLVSLAVD